MKEFTGEIIKMSEKEEGVSSQDVQLCTTCNEPLIKYKWWQLRSKIGHFWRDVKENWHTTKLVRISLDMMDLKEEDRFLILCTVKYDDLRTALLWKQLEHIVTGEDVE